MKAIHTLTLVLCAALLPAITSCTESARQRHKQRDLDYCKSIGAGSGNALANCMLTLRGQNQVVAAQQAQINNQLIYQPASRPVVSHCQQYSTGLVCHSF